MKGLKELGLMALLEEVCTGGDFEVSDFSALPVDQQVALNSFSSTMSDRPKPLKLHASSRETVSFVRVGLFMVPLHSHRAVN